MHGDTDDDVVPNLLSTVIKLRTENHTLNQQSRNHLREA